MSQANRLPYHLLISDVHARLPQRIPSFQRYDPAPILRRPRIAAMPGGYHRGTRWKQDRILWLCQGGQGSSRWDCQYGQDETVSSKVEITCVIGDRPLNRLRRSLQTCRYWCNIIRYRHQGVHLAAKGRQRHTWPGDYDTAY